MSALITSRPLGTPHMIHHIIRILWAIIARLGHPTEWDERYP